MKTNKKGISLIVLVITIVVMIIIAAAVILYLDESKVVKNAEKAVTMSNVSAAKEVVTVARAEWRINKEKIKEENKCNTYKEYAEYKLEEAGFEIGNNGGQVQVSENGLLLAYYEPIIPLGYVASNVSTEDDVSEGLVIYEGSVPVTDNNVEDARKTRNQYVWVPVPNMSDFVRKEWGMGVSISQTTSYNLSDVNEEKEYTAMKESVAKYGGFYIARYEAGFPEGKNKDTVITTDKPVSKKEVSVWSGINWNDSKEKCETISTDTVVGHLIYGEEWDAALNFISNTDADYATNSTDKGNYSNSIAVTGSSVNYAKNNIYDMAGNVWEWTQESYSSTSYIIRGGYYGRPATTYSASYRYLNETSYTYLRRL